jgi:hypothetical protein
MVAKLASELAPVTCATVAHDGLPRGMGSRLESILELHPMMIVGNTFCIEGRFVEFFGVKTKTFNTSVWC